MACRFPDAPDVHSLWQNIQNRHSSIRPIAHGRWHQSLFESLSARDPMSISSHSQAYLDDVEHFAGPYFGISPRRGQVMDPQQRLCLELAREALQDAGLERAEWDRSRSGAFVGASISEYNQLCGLFARLHQVADGDFGESADRQQVTRLGNRCLPIRIYTLPGNLLSMCAGVVSQFYDLGGPSLAMDAACASSLVAVVQAVEYLRGLAPGAGPAPVALAGGVYLGLLPDNLVAFSRVGALASDDCRPFDRDAAGFILGEGAGMVVLKRLRDAVRDRDRVYAVIHGAACNADGASEGPMTPRAEGQKRCLAQALGDWDDVGYVECHGTGTLVGDAVELEALSAVMPGSPRLGSIKSNIGHTISAAGVAGLIRAALAIHHRVLPPQTGFAEWHPNLKHHAEKFEIAVSARPWAGRRRATVSAFGFGGTNAVVALEEAEPLPELPRGEELLFCCSAPTAPLLRSYLRELEARLDETPLAAMAYTQTVHREVFDWVCIFATRDDPKSFLLAAVEALADPPERLALLEPGLVLGPRSQDQLLELTPLLAQGVAHVLGRPVELEKLFPGRQLVNLPVVPLERQRYWVIEPK